MEVSGIKCLNCGDIIYSRARHDFHWCSCESVAIDGGFDYIRVIGDKYKFITLEVNATKEELYKDWNHKIDKYGTVKNVSGDKTSDKEGV